MPDHLHLLGQLRPGASLGAGVSRIKAIVAREVNNIRGASTALWARAYHDHAVRREEDILAAARYIVANPVRAGLVRSVRDYPYWDSVWLQQPNPLEPSP